MVPLIAFPKTAQLPPSFVNSSFRQSRESSPPGEVPGPSHRACAYFRAYFNHGTGIPGILPPLLPNHHFGQGPLKLEHSSLIARSTGWKSGAPQISYYCSDEATCSQQNFIFVCFILKNTLLQMVLKYHTELFSFLECCLSIG